MTHRPVLLQLIGAINSFSLLAIVSILISTNVHAAWENQTGLTGKPIGSIAVDPVDNNKVFVGTTSIPNSPASMGLYQSAGVSTQKTWTQVTNASLSGHVIRSVAIAPDSSFANQKMFVAVAPDATSQTPASPKGIYKSIDGGINWTASQIAHPNLPGLFLTDDIAQIVITNRVNNIQNIYVVVQSDEHGGQGDGLYVSSNDGLSWIKRNGTSDINRIAISPSEPNTVFFDTRSSHVINKSTDGGVTFIQASSGLPTGIGAGIIDFAIDPINANNVYASAYENGIFGFYYSSNKGQSWTRNSTDVFYKIAVSPVFNENKVYGVKNDNLTGGAPIYNVYMSQNNGTSWSKVDPSSTVFSSQTIYAMTAVNDSVYVAADDGLYINAQSGTVPTAPIANNTNLSVPFGSTFATGSLTATKVSSTDVLTFTVISPFPTKGTFQITNAQTGAFTYTPFANQVGVDIIRFNVSDQLNRTSTIPGSISITIQSTAPTNPTPVNSTVNMAAGTTTVNGVLSAQKVAVTDTLTYTVVPGNSGTKGTLTITNPNTGTFTYTANAGQTGTDTASFSVRDQMQRTSLVNGIVTINLSGTGAGTGTTAVDLDITAPIASQQTTVQAGGDLTYNLKLSNLSTTQNSGTVTITSSQVPVGATLVVGSYETCVLRSNRVITCTISSMRRESTLNISIILKMPVTLNVTNISTTFSVTTVGTESNTTNNTTPTILTTIGAGTGTGTGSGATIPVARSTSLVASPGTTINGQFEFLSKVNPTDTLRYVIVSNGTLGTLTFTSPVVGTPNTSNSPSFTYSARAGVVGNDTINFKVIDNLNRESAIKSVIISVQSPSGSGAGAVDSGGESGGAINPWLLVLGLLPLVFRRRKK